jgi:hypothetical protein
MGAPFFFSQGFRNQRLWYDHGSHDERDMLQLSVFFLTTSYGSHDGTRVNVSDPAFVLKVLDSQI